MATATKAAAATRATRDGAIAAAAIRKALALRAVNAAREANRYTSHSRSEETVEYAAASQELDRLVDEAIEDGV